MKTDLHRLGYCNPISVTASSLSPRYSVACVSEIQGHHCKSVTLVQTSGKTVQLWQRAVSESAEKDYARYARENDREMIVNSSKVQEKHQQSDTWSPDYGEEIQIRREWVLRWKLSTVKEEAKTDASDWYPRQAFY